ncbi:nucleotide sugar dehydrogenase [Meridianimarinicoccus aquatilis]|uniref:UDP-glucose 6-dehydrogenase n=1 Tax=Meridianimarinicoccus aquatilis TaxID=2552766 RepID=A0A4R6AEI0_9RHOB|nr:nucleotide sugar dehydrogenase [Fluviibacterium aquatile]QIE44003.1 nucleotide sugar dehydrogenase [Rhodobacteraceae bacterium SC52]TDL81452.1 nucleotide sugar dehydrogenase [Fluviibacterium aquatile]
MKVVIFGLGYVGFTAACCIASEGHQVVGIDVSAKKVDAIRAGHAPIVEPGVEEMLRSGLEKGLIDAATEIGHHLDEADLAIVCVGTPSGPDGSHNMAYIADVSRQIAAAVDPARKTPLSVAYRSTIRPGSIEELIAPIFKARLGDATDAAIALVYNPEFLRESSAVKDYFEPPKIVIGTKDGQPDPAMETLNANITAPTFHVGYREAEFTKFVDNTWHAVKVAYANEIGRVCLQLGIKASTVHEIFKSDTKLNISAYYTRPGGAFGGSCLPKDVRALQYIAADSGAPTPLVDSLLRSNEAHKHRLYEYAAEGLEPGAKVLLAGLAFKAGTDDLRESPNVDLARKLLAAGFDLDIYDPAIDAAKLVGANLGYAYSQLPTIEGLLVDKAAAEAGNYARVIVTNATVKDLDLSADVEQRDLGSLP